MKTTKFSGWKKFAEKMTTDVKKVEQQYQLKRLEIKKDYIGKIEKMRQAMDIGLVLVDQNNLHEVSEKIRNLVHNEEGVEDNISLKVGDRVIWNSINKTLIISDNKGLGKFFIRFTPETKQEMMQSIKMAQEMQDKGALEWGKGNNANENHEANNISAGKILGDWIVKRRAYPGAKNSCGASCGELLNQFGFRKILPQSGRDGKNWDTILENYASEYFTKIPVSHPDDAPSGSVVVFNENAQLGSSARRKHGHVEIKGSNGRYYSYYDSVNAGGSSKTSEKNPEKYKKLTGFTGYAYVYNGKKPPR